MITSTASSARGRNLHITPKMEDRSPNIARDLTGQRSSLENNLVSKINVYVCLFAHASLSHNLTYKDPTRVLGQEGQRQSEA